MSKSSCLVSSNSLRCAILDLMGAGSTCVSSLYTVGQYKKRYAQHVIEVDGVWDVPVSRVIYSGMSTAKRLRDALRARRGSREH